MSSKTKSSRLRLRSQTAHVNSRNQKTAVISHYFKKSSSESDEVPSTSEISSKENDKSEVLSSCENKDISNSVQVNSDKSPRTKVSKTKKLLDLLDDLSDFLTPKPIKRVVPKIFEPKFKPKPVPKRNKKSINKKITEESRKFLYESKDYNQEHLQVAIALSKSIQDIENPGESSQSQADNELTPTQENVLKIRKKLTKFQFNKNTDAFESKSEDIPLKGTKSKKTRNNPFMSILIRRTCEDRENIIQRKISNILLEKVIINQEKQFYSDLKICDNLEKYFCNEKILFKKAELTAENFYTNELVTPTTAKCGNLLRDWSKILGREVTPPREIETSKAELEQNQLEASKYDQHKNSQFLEVQKDFCMELNVKVPENLNDSSKSNSLTSIENDIELSRKLETSKYDQHKNSQILEVQKDFCIELNVEVPNNLNNSNISNSLTSIENNIEVSNFLEASKLDQHKSSEILELQKDFCMELNVEVSKSLSDSSKSNSLTSIENNIEVSKKLGTSNQNREIGKKSEILEFSQLDFINEELQIPKINSNNPNEQIIPNKNITIRSLTPDLFSDSEDEIFFENHQKNQTFIVPPTIEENILDLTQSSNSTVEDLTQSSEKHSDHNSDDNSNNSNDSLFDLPKFDIKYTTTAYKSKNDVSQELDSKSVLVDLSQSSNSNDHESQETKNCSNDEMETFLTKSPSNKNLNLNLDFENNEELFEQSSNTTNYNISQEISIKRFDIENISNRNLTEESQDLDNDQEMLVDLSQSSNSNDENSSTNISENLSDETPTLKKCSKKFYSENNLNKSNFKTNIENDEEMHIDLSRGDNYSINRFSMKTPKKNNFSNNKNTPMKYLQNESENSTPKSTLSSFDFKLKRKSKSFTDENQIQNNASLRKYNLFMENFDYELETSTHISINANKPKIIESNTSNTQTESDDSLIIINDDELNYSCSTPYRKIFRNVSKNESPSKLQTESKETNFTSPKNNIDSLERVEPKNTNESPSNISLLLGDSFEWELRRTTSLWDRVCGKKQIEISKSQTPHKVHKKNNFETPKTQMEIKTHDITPIPNYDEMETPEIRKELEKYGLKSLKRRRAAQILQYIYEQTHPYDGETSVSSSAVETYSDTEDNSRQVKRSKCTSSTKLDHFIPATPTKIEIVGDLLSKNYSESDLVFETRQSTKIASCRLPFHIAWHNYLSEKPELRLKILKYFPIQLEEICVDFKQMGFKYHVNDILSFLDKKCITIRTNQNSHRNQKPKSTSTNTKTKRY